MKLSVLYLLFLSFLSCVLCTSYFFGSHTPGSVMIRREKVILYAFPWKKRVETFSFNDTSERPIQAIDCHDYQRTEATVNITGGGIGYPYVTLRFKSQRSYGLEYAVEIFAEN